MASMGLKYGLEKTDFCIKRPYRWLFVIPGVAADDTPGVNALPPEKSARPSMSFKEMEVRHLIEDVYFPAKPDWKTVNITLFDLTKLFNPVFEWIKTLYDPQGGKFFQPNTVDGQGLAVQQRNRFIKECSLNMYDGCGNIIERWIYEDGWPQAVNFQTLDMGSSNYMTYEITLRYARAYIYNG